MPVTSDMVNAATEIYKLHFPEWQLCNASLEQLRHRFPEWNEKSCVLKAAAINELYGTNVYSLVPLARSISYKMLRPDTERDRHLVEYLAAHPTTNRREISFSSKFCHFFVDPSRYPILDQVVCDTLKHFLGPEYVSNGNNRYDAFLENLKSLRSKSPELNRPEVDNSALDRFLWLFGLWRRFRTNVKINAEAKGVFRDPPKDIMRRLVPGYEDEGPGRASPPGRS